MIFLTLSLCEKRKAKTSMVEVEDFPDGQIIKSPYTMCLQSAPQLFPLPALDCHEITIWLMRACVSFKSALQVCTI